jgi:hypothetical protein
LSLLTAFGGKAVANVVMIVPFIRMVVVCVRGFEPLANC